MNKEEIDYWLKIFYDERHGFKSRDDKVISLYKVFEELKELHNKIDKAIEYINIVGIKTDKPKYFQMIKDTIWGEELLEILKDSDVDE
jgi:hypothetical protein